MRGLRTSWTIYLLIKSEKLIGRKKMCGLLHPSYDYTPIIIRFVLHWSRWLSHTKIQVCLSCLLYLLTWSLLFVYHFFPTIRLYTVLPIQKGEYPQCSAMSRSLKISANQLSQFYHVLLSIDLVSFFYHFFLTIRLYRVLIYILQDLVLCTLPYHDTHALVYIVQLISTVSNNYFILSFLSAPWFII